MITKTFIEKSIREEKFRMTDHAHIRRLSRGVWLKKIKEMLLQGKIIEINEKAKPNPTAIVLGFKQSGDPIHVVISKAQVEPQLRIVTVYEPDESEWDSTFTKRKRRR